MPKYGLVKSEFDIFERKPIQTGVLETKYTEYKPIGPLDQDVLEFLIPNDNERYIDLNIYLKVKGQLTKLDGSPVLDGNIDGVVNNLLHSLFSDCTVTLNGTTVTSAKDLYPYRAYIETLLSYGSDAANTHLSSNLWYIDNGDMKAVEKPAEAALANANQGFQKRWERCKHSKTMELCGKVHSDLFNVGKHLIPGVRMQIKFDRTKNDFYVWSHSADAKVMFKITDASLYVNHVKASPEVFNSHTTVLAEGATAHYPLNRVALKTFTFSRGSKSLSIDNAVIGALPKRILFTMIKNSDFTGSVNSNPFNFQHFKLNSFVMYVNGNQIPSGGLNLDTKQEMTTTLAYQTLFKGSGIHHGNSGIQITPDMYVHGYFMLLYDLTPDHAASEGHGSLRDNGSLRIELQFDEALPDAVTCLLYLEYDGSVDIDGVRNVTTDF